MEIANPRRVLAVSLEDEHSIARLSRVIKDLSGSYPTPSVSGPESDDSSPREGKGEGVGRGPGDEGARVSASAEAKDTSASEETETETKSSFSLAGTTHVLPLRTPYYAAAVPVWLDTVADPAAWAAAFLAEEAREVLGVLGGVVAVLALSPPESVRTTTTTTTTTPPLPSARSDAVDTETETETEVDAGARSRALVAHVGRVVREGLGWDWDGVGLVVGVAGEGGAPPPTGEELEAWEDACAAAGLEFVLVAPGTGGDVRNEFGEKTGIPRALEALQANDWSQAPSSAGILGDEDDDSEDGEGGGSLSDFGDFAVPGVGFGAGQRDPLDPAGLAFGFDREDFAGLRQAIWTAGRERQGDGEEGEDGDGDGGEAAGAHVVSEKKNERGEEEGRVDGQTDSGDFGDDDDEELNEQSVQALERMMRRLQAVRDASAGLPEDQRRRMAARAVGEVMREL